MRRHLSIRWKVLAVLALPVIVVALACGVLAYDALGQAQTRRQMGTFAEAQTQVNEMIAALQAERLASSATGPDQATALDEVRRDTDRALTRLDITLAETGIATGVPGASAVLSGLDSAHFRITEQRRLVDAGEQVEAVLAAYSTIIAADVELPGEMAGVLSDRLLAQRFTAATELARANEAASQIHLIGLGMVRAGVATQPQQNQLAVAIADHDRALGQFAASGSVVDPSVQQQATAAAERFSGFAADLQRRQGLPIGLPESTWTDAATAQSDALRRLAADVTRDAAAQAESSAEAAQQRVALTSATAVALVGLMILLALMQSRQITAPLRRLANVTTRTREELPGAVEAIIVHGASSAELPAVGVEAKDEVGDVAAAFRDVQDTVIGIAHEQAELRGALAETFVNVARRNQVLLARQLSFIDRLERSEENPDALENLFRLDHLATRMRRNAESLLVLAGVDSGRRARSPMPLSDVVRTAISEIEHYERVDLDNTVNPLVVAHLALPTAHLVAELIENATLFSDPSSRVWVRTETGPEGVEVLVADRGLGMSAEDLAQANERIADTETSAVVPVHTQGASRLGLYVVARLATRLGAQVSLAPGDGGGTLVRVLLPSAVFVEGSAPPATGVMQPIDVADAERREDPRGSVGRHAHPVDQPFAGAAPSAAPELPSAPVADFPALEIPPAPEIPPAKPTSSDPFTPVPVAPEPVPAPAEPAPEPIASESEPGQPRPLPRRRPGGRTPTAAGSDVPSEFAAVHEAGPAGPPAQPATEWAAESEPEAAVESAVESARVEPPVLAPPSVVAEPAPRPTIPATVDVLPNSGRSGRSKGLFGRRGRTRAEAVPDQQPFAVPPPEAQAPSGWLASAAPDDGTRWGWAHRSDASGPGEAGVAEEAAAHQVGPQASQDSSVHFGRSDPTAQAPSSPHRSGDVNARSALASTALSELSMLASYRPAVGNGSPATLVRRRPAETPVESPAPPPVTIGPVRPSRTAEGVRATLSGFVTGAARGRGRGGLRGFDLPAASDQTATTEEDYR